MRKTVISIMILALLLGLSLAACRIAGDDPEPIKGEESELSWQLSLPEVDEASSWGLEDVCLDEDTGEAWAVGWKYVGGDYPEPLVLHYQSDQWVEDDPADDIVTASPVGALMGVGVAPTGDVWCVGYSLPDYGPMVLVKSAVQWQPLSIEEGPPLASVTFNGAGEAVVAGQSEIIEFNGHDPGTPSGTSGPVLAIDWADHGYAAGYVAGATTDSSPAIWESPDNYNTNQIAGLNISGELNDVDFADGSGWAVGYAGSDCLLVQRSGGTWTQYEPLVRPGVLTGVSMVSASEGWAVGYEEIVGDETEQEQGILLSYLLGDWTEPFADVGKLAPYSWRLNAVSAVPTGEAWAVGTVTIRIDVETNKSRGVAFHYTDNRAPVLDAIGDQSYPLGGSLTFTVHATDPDDDQVTYSAFNLPDVPLGGEAQFDPDTATFTWGGPNAGNYEGDTVFVVTDSYGLSDFEVVHISGPLPGAGGPS